MGDLLDGKRTHLACAVLGMFCLVVALGLVEVPQQVQTAVTGGLAAVVAVFLRLAVSKIETATTEEQAKKASE